MLLINGVRSGKSTWKQGLVGSSCLVMAANSTIPVLLCEDDIPGTSLAGQQPASLKNAELRYWMKWRGLPSLVSKYSCPGNSEQVPLMSSVYKSNR